MATSTTTKKKASRSGNPATRAKAVAPTAASAWKTNAQIEDVELPSGNVARVRRVGPEVFLSQGLIPDSLTAIVEKAVHSKRGLKPVQQKEIMDDPKQVGAALEMMDRVLCYAVVEPLVEMPPACEQCGEYNKDDVLAHKTGPEFTHRYIEAQRDDDVLYADVVSLDDKSFIMNYCLGGTRDLERFRKEFGAGLGSLGVVQDDEDQAI
jgi:hypothetical protein